MNIRLAVTIAATLCLSGMQTGSVADVQPASIVLQADPTQIEKFAAAELQRCLAASLGWSVSRASWSLINDGEPAAPR
jgi:hypothetical protein